MNKSTLIGIAIAFMGGGFVIRFITSEWFTKGTETVGQPKGRTFIGYGAMLLGIVIGILIFNYAQGLPNT